MFIVYIIVGHFIIGVMLYASAWIASHAMELILYGRRDETEDINDGIF
jgi:hypothetical protein